MTHRETIAEYLADAPNIQDAAHTLKVFARPHLDNRQFEKGSRELDRLTSNLPSVLRIGTDLEDAVSDYKNGQISPLCTVIAIPLA